MDPAYASPAVAVAIVVAAAALLTAIIALIVLARRRAAPTAGPDIVHQIETVRSELRELTELFLVPRTRGAVGETILGELLATWLPQKSFELQYGFSNGTRVDAVIRLGARLVPVDSKFPLESIQRHFEQSASHDFPADVRTAFRRHVADIEAKYINPSEGTLGFALMYIPSERVYVELFASRNDELMRAALEHNVVPVSPATLFVYLQTVAYGLRGLAISGDTRRLLDHLRELESDLAAFSKSFELAGGHLRNLSRAFDDATSRLQRVEVRAERLGEDQDRG